MTRQKVVAALRNALDLDGAELHDEFDMFVARPILDPYLESLRQEILALARTEGQPVCGRDFGPKAEEWLRRTLDQLE
jgi:hypothetical protein